METVNLMPQKDIVAYLDKHVIGQDEAKKTLAVAVYNHYKLILSKNRIVKTDTELDDVRI